MAIQIYFAVGLYVELCVEMALVSFIHQSCLLSAGLLVCVFVSVSDVFVIRQRHVLLIAAVSLLNCWSVLTCILDANVCLFGCICDVENRIPECSSIR